jgi:hypothetical protein
MGDMAERILGPQGSQRRRRFLWVPMLAVAALALFLIAGAQAVHDTGSFQLDGDASSSTQPFGPTATDDWDKVCHQVAAIPAASCGASSDTTNATAVAWASDGNLNATIFTGGGSKDPQDISSWAWKDGAGGLPDKDNLLHSFAARYSLPNDPVDSVPPGAGNLGNGTACPVGNATPPPPTCDLLFFGSDRYDNSGDAQQGFWFFQKKVTLGNVSSGGGFNFNGVHTNGDILVISDFSNGGTTSTITVYAWDNTVNGNLRLLETSTAAKCSTVGAGDAFCGIVNGADGTVAPWSSDFTDKSGLHTYLNGEFYEGGINLSTLGLSGECFSSIASETRSSTSTTATLKDFVLGQFAVCGASISTTPSAGVTDATAVAPGTSVTDLATVTGTGTTNPPDPTSPPNVVFSYCGPTATNATDLCTTGGTSAGSSALDGGINHTDGIATATSDAINTAASPLAPGRYCFRAEWAGDSNYSGPFSHSGIGNSECFVVRQIPTSTVTTPSDGSGVPLAAHVALGTHLFDKAVVTGTAIGGTPTGTVAFTLCTPAQVIANGDGTCSSGGSAVGGAVTLTGVSGSSPPAASALSADGGAAAIAGTWCFRAVYSPTGSTYTGSGDATTDECVIVDKLDTTTVTTPSGSSPHAVNDSVTDHAVVTANASGDGTPTGTITFFICSPSQTTGAAGSEVCATGGTQLNTATAVAVANSSPPASAADSSSVTANVVGTWCFRAVYAPSGTNGGNYNGSSDARHSECFTVKDATTGTSAQNWLPNDSATVTSTGGTALNGTLSFTLYSGGDCGATGGSILVPAESFTLTNAVSPATRATTNATIKVSATATVSWKVVFSSSDSNVGGFTKCSEVTSLTIAN